MRSRFPPPHPQANDLHLHSDETSLRLRSRINSIQEEDYIHTKLAKDTKRKKQFLPLTSKRRQCSDIANILSFFFLGGGDVLC